MGKGAKRQGKEDKSRIRKSENGRNMEGMSRDRKRRGGKK